VRGESVLNVCRWIFRKGSPTYGQGAGAILLKKINVKFLGCHLVWPHGFVVCQDIADLNTMYRFNYDPADEGFLMWNDPDVGIEWPRGD